LFPDSRQPRVGSRYSEEAAHMLWSDFQKPKKLEYDAETLTPNYGRFVAQPFERGFGTTIGNALRRVLLSSI
jgi:DNA-directed RNA polymerase subunit alpha